MSGGLNTAGVTCHCSELLPFALLLWPLLQKEVGGGSALVPGVPYFTEPCWLKRHKNTTAVIYGACPKCQAPLGTLRGVINSATHNL